MSGRREERGGGEGRRRGEERGEGGGRMVRGEGERRRTRPRYGPMCHRLSRPPETPRQTMRQITVNLLATPPLCH